MGPKKKGGKKGGKKKGDSLLDPSDEIKAFNLAERQVVMERYERMSELREINDTLKAKKDALEATKREDED